MTAVANAPQPGRAPLSSAAATGGSSAAAAAPPSPDVLLALLSRNKALEGIYTLLFKGFLLLFSINKTHLRPKICPMNLFIFEQILSF